MSRVVLDASALLAFVRREPGGEMVRDLLAGALLSAVNLAEVLGVSADHGADLAQTEARLRVLPITIVPFDRDDARQVAAFRPATRGRGLSLGDRCCLALGVRTGLPVVTADRAWAGLSLGFDLDVRLIR